jgi:hypothetical protein
MGIAVADTGFVSGVGRLNELLRYGEIVSDDDVDVLAGRRSFLCVAHVGKTTPEPVIFQE